MRACRKSDGLVKAVQTSAASAQFKGSDHTPPEAIAAKKGSGL